MSFRPEYERVIRMVRSAGFQVLLFVACIAFGCGSPPDQRQEMLRIDETKHTILSLAQTIDAAHANIGRVPNDEKELVESLAGDMPKTAWTDPVRYIRLSDDSYRLETVTEGSAGMIYIYFSADPDAGVHRFPF